MDLVTKGNKVLAKVLGHYTQLEIDKGKGSYLFAKNGKKYLDFASGIAVTNTGHCHPLVVKAAKEQTSKIIHNCASVTYTDANIKFCEKLQKIVPITNAKFFLCQSGSEAIEGAIKCAKYTTKKENIYALQGGFHGRTFGAMSATSSNNKYKEGYGKLVPSIKVIARNIRKIKKIDPKKTAAILTELVLGEGGYLASDKKFIKELALFCKQKKILLIIDEVQSGMGRTGKMFASEWYGINPDIMTLSKGIASGFPLGAVVINPIIANKWDTSAHGGTFTGNLVSCAAGSATINIIKKELPKMNAKIKILDFHLINMQKKYPKLIKGINGLGFMKGILFKESKIVKTIMQKSLAKGLLIISTGKDGKVIRIVPPVTISNNDLTKGLKIIEKVLNNL